MKLAFTVQVPLMKCKTVFFNSVINRILQVVGFELHAFICSTHEALGAIGLNSAALNQLATIQFHYLFSYKSPDKTVIHFIKMLKY